MLNETAIAMKTNRMTVGLTEAAKMIGSEKLLRWYISQDIIRVTRTGNAKNAKWRCNLWDVLQKTTTNHRKYKQKS